jgi:threonine synthase
VSTASPFKFNESVARAILGEEAVAGKSEYELLGILAEECALEIPVGLAGLENKEILHKGVCGKDEMKETVRQILQI